jgi:YD repeat-containing protein
MYPFNLKAINHPSLDPANDAGQDGTGTGANGNVAKDAFALGFSYHDGDFEKTVGSTPSPFNTNNTSFLKHEGTGLWSGFIGATTLHLAEITVPSGSTLMRNGALMGERLKYDRIGRLRVVTTYENVGNTWTSDATSGWSSSYMYDQNSNLTRVKRSEALSATPGLYDDVTIAPKDLSGNNSNVIDVVTDAGTNAVAGFTDLRTQTTAQNAVDVTGRVTTESNSGLARTNTWTSTDALSTATAGTTEARYLYDAAGNVVRVIVDNAGTDSTIYRIPSGGIADVATYKRVGNGNVVPMEWTIIGNGVIGVSRDVEDPETGPTFHRRVGTKLYALADHLGSIRAVVGDVKIPASGGTFTADVMAVYDYEAYGVPRPGLSLDVRAYWRYGFQGMLKQSELLGSTTDVSDYLTPFRSYDARSGRWRSHDPIFQPWESTYLGMGGNPAMLVDPWGLDDLVIFVSGFMKSLNPLSSFGITTPIYQRIQNPYQRNHSYEQPLLLTTLASWTPAMFNARLDNLRVPVYSIDPTNYWGKIDDLFIKSLGAKQNQVYYLQGGATPNSTPMERELLGRIGAVSLQSKMTHTTSYDWIIIIDHSQGDGYGAGLADELIDRGYNVHTIVSIAPKDAAKIELNPMIRKSITLYSPFDLIAPYSGRPQNGSTLFSEFKTPDWAIPSQIREKWLTEPGSAQIERVAWGAGGHSIDTFDWFFSSRFKNPILPLSMLPELANPLMPATR